MKASVALCLGLVAVSWMGCGGGGEGKKPVDTGSTQEQDLCGRSQGVLLGLASAPRSCVLTEDCPTGSRCDRLSGTCHWSCLASGEGEHGCPSGKSCNCDGDCVDDPGQVAPVATTDEKTLEVATPVVQPPAPSADGAVSPTQVEFTLSGSTSGQDLPPSVTVRVRAPEGAEVSCIVGPNAVFSRECDWSTTHYQLVGGKYRIEGIVEMRPVAGANNGPWVLDLRGDEWIGKTVSILMMSPLSSSPPREGRFHGVLAQEGMTAPLQVDAWIRGNNLLISDPGNGISNSGKWLVDLTDSVGKSFVLLQQSSEGAGAVIASIRQEGMAFDEKGALDGTLYLKVPPGNELKYNLSLQRVGDVEPVDCSAGASCETGYVCQPEVQACVPGAAWESVAGSVRSTVDYQRYDQWTDRGTTVFLMATPLLLSGAQQYWPVSSNHWDVGQAAPTPTLSVIGQENYGGGITTAACQVAFSPGVSARYPNALRTFFGAPFDCVQFAQEHAINGDQGLYCVPPSVTGAYDVGNYRCPGAITDHGHGLAFYPVANCNETQARFVLNSPAVNVPVYTCKVRRDQGVEGSQYGCYREGNYLADSLSVSSFDPIGRTCVASGQPSRDFPLFTYADDLRKGRTASQTLPAMLAACRSEMRSSPPQGDISGNEYASINSFLARGACVSPGGAFMRLATNGPSAGRDVVETLAQWVAVKNFIAVQGKEQGELARTLELPGTPVRAADVLGELLPAWDLVLGRNWNLAVPGHEGTTVQPLFIGALEALSSEADLLYTALDLARRQGTTTDLDAAKKLYSQYNRYALAVEGMMADPKIGNRCDDVSSCQSLTSLASCRGTGCGFAKSYQDRWLTARAEIHAKRSKLLGLMESMRLNRNGMGLREDEAPIYQGDEQKRQSDYFASSDFLLGSVAAPAVSDAETAYSTTRGSWQNWYNNEIQNLAQTYAQSQRLDAIKTSFGQRVVDYCGLGVDATSALASFGDSIKPETCYIDPACRDSADMAPTCYRGALGQAALKYRMARMNADIAVQEANDLEERYSIKYGYCADLKQSLEKDDELIKAHNAYIKHEEERKKKRSFWKKAFSWYTSAASILISAVTESPGGAVGAAVSFVNAEMDKQVSDINSAIALSDRDHDALMRARSSQVAIKQCQSEADVLHVGVRSADLRIQNSLLEAQSAILAMQDMLRQLQQGALEANAEIAREEGRTLPPASYSFVSKDLDVLQQKMEWGRKVVYITVQAMEYEYQCSLSVKQDVLKADSPSQLDKVLKTLKSLQLTGKVVSKTPVDNTEVLSLQKDILKLQDFQQVDLPDELKPRYQSAAERLNSRLSSTEFAVYSPAGAYLGQGVPFTFQEQGILKSQCGERLTRVVATVQGDFANVDAPNIRLKLAKRTRFSSQYCGTAGGGEKYQTSSIRPSSDFSSANASTATSAYDDWTYGVMTAWFNIPKSDFYGNKYAENMCPAFAGEGLYGDYILLFPVEELTDRKFPISSVEDVLIRFDYKAIDNSAYVTQ